ncbi:ABC transporter permease [Humibacter ginsenosidimutans]|uniref:ABC transporter permease n=1 Tax=Humibacter ginsenosidimutans TaxID=2599293 RepID=A0A5B8M2V8_9MICO|nr:ABC transporter permease [Humibacter ginsenosidimutans]QDZ14491.1 ABC transporter permease [Humibacter ginsenosidimutans]
MSLDLDDTAVTTVTTRIGSEQRYTLADVEAGLDSLQSDEQRWRGSWRRAAGSVLLPVAVLVLLVVVWQLSVWIAQPRPDIVPSPLAVAQSFGDLWSSGRLQQAVLTSLERGVFGFLIAVAVGTPIGLLLSEVPLLRRAVGPLISGLQVLPSVAWVPAAILWFGLSDATAYFVVLMGATPSIVNGLLSGVDQVPPQLRRVGKVLGASRWQQATLVVMPAALPGYLGGLKQGWAFSWRSLMAAEIITTGGTMGFGLGTLLDQSRQLADLPGVIVTIVGILVIGIVVELLVFAPIERRLARARGLARGEAR